MFKLFFRSQKRPEADGFQSQSKRYQGPAMRLEEMRTPSGILLDDTETTDDVGEVVDTDLDWDDLPEDSEQADDVSGDETDPDSVDIFSDGSTELDLPDAELEELPYLEIDGEEAIADEPSSEPESDFVSDITDGVEDELDESSPAETEIDPVTDQADNSDDADQDIEEVALMETEAETDDNTGDESAIATEEELITETTDEVEESSPTAATDDTDAEVTEAEIIAQNDETDTLNSSISDEVEPVDSQTAETAVDETEIEAETEEIAEEETENSLTEEETEPFVTEETENSVTEEESESIVTDEVIENDPEDSVTSETAETTEDSETSDSEEETTDDSETEESDLVGEAEFSNLQPKFESGTFTVGETGEVQVDFLFDGGAYKGQVAIVSLSGMEAFDLNSPEFFQEAISRAASNTELGYTIIDDHSEGGRFTGKLGEPNYNSGEYQGVKTFSMRPGDEFFLILVPNGTVEQVLNNPNAGGALRPLFSLATANPDDGYHFGQIADITGDGSAFAWEDIRVDGGSDRDYNDIILQFRGAKGKAALMDDVVAEGKDWRGSDLGQALIEYVKTYVTPDPPDFDAAVEDLLANLDSLFFDEVDSFEEDLDSLPDSDVAEEISLEEEIPTEDETEVTDVVDESELEEITDVVDETEVADVVDEPELEAVTDVVDETEVADVVDEPELEEITDVVDEPEVADVVDEPELEEITDVVDEPELEAVTEVADETEVADVVEETELEAVTEVADETEVADVVDEPELETVTEVADETEVADVVDEPELEAVTEVGDETEVSDVVDEPELEAVTEVGDETEVSDVVDEPELEAVTEVADVVAETELEEVSSVTDETTSESLGEGEETETPGFISEAIATQSELSETPPPEEFLETDPFFIPELSPTELAKSELIFRLESLTEVLNFQANNSEVSSSPPVNPALIERLETLTQTIQNRTPSQPISDSTFALVSRLEEMIWQSYPSIPIAEHSFNFALANQPLVGIIDTGFSGNNPDIDYSRITWGQDHIDGDNDPTIAPGEGNEHGTHTLGIIAAQRDNDIGIDGINPDAPIWAGRAVGSGKWAESLIEFVDAARESGQPNAVANLSLDLTQIDAQGNVTTRYEFTPMERAAIEYARQHNVMLVVAAGNDGGVMSALGQASQEFDNIITVGAAERFNEEIALSKAYNRTEYSSYGYGLDIVAPGGTIDNPQLSLTGEGVSAMAGTSVATAKVTGAISQVWAANPSLSYRQVIEIVKNTATDLGATGFDLETGAGLLNMVAAVQLAKATTGEEHHVISTLIPETWGGEGVFTAGERAAQNVMVPPEWRRWYYGWLNDSNPSDTFSFSIDEPTPLQFSLNFMGSVVLRKNGQVVLEGKSDGNMLYAGSNGKLSPGSYVLTVNRGNHSNINEYRLVMNFLEGSQGQEVPIIDYLSSLKPAQPPTENPPITNIPELIKTVAEKRAEEAIFKAYQTNQQKLGNALKDIQVHWKAFDGKNVPAVQYFDGGYIIWNGVSAIPYFTGTGHKLPNLDLPETVAPIWQPTPKANIVNVPDGRHTYPNMRGSSEYWVDLKGSKNVMNLAARNTVLTHPDLRTTVYRDLGNGRLQQVPLTGVNPDENYANFQDLPAGKYLIKVDVAQGKTNIPYEMIVNLDQAGDSLVNARHLNWEHGKIDGKRIIVSDHVGVPQGDKDLYAFTTSNFQPVLQLAVRSLYSDLNEETKNRLLDGDIKMRLLDANGKEVLSVNSVNRQPTFAAEKLKPNSKYYIEVTARNGSRTNYDLVLNFEQIWAQSGRHEFKGLTGQLEYNFQVDSNATARTLHTAVRDVNGKTVDPVHYTSTIYRQWNGQWVAVNPNSTGNSVFLYDSLATGQYRVVMTPKPSMPSSSYTFVHNLDQAGQTRSEARNLGQIGGKRVTVNDHVGIPTGDEDYYKFSTGSDPRLLQFAVRHPSGTDSLLLEGNVEFILYDKNGKELKKVNSQNRKSIYDTHELQPNSEYYVRIKAQSGHSGNYHLVLNAEVKRTVKPDPKNEPNPVSGGPIDTYPKFLHRLYGGQPGTIGQYPHSGHWAIDSTQQGSFPRSVYALASGKITVMASDKYGGKYIDIYNSSLDKTFRYLHFDSYASGLHVGKSISAGTVIGVEGYTGLVSPPGPQGRHTHFAVLQNNIQIDPWPTLRRIP